MLKNDVLNLRDQVNNQQNGIHDTEPYSRKEYLEIRGIDEDPHYEEDTNDIVADLIGVEIAEQDISVIHRLLKLKHSDSPPTINAKIVRYDVRDQFYKNRKSSKDKSTSPISPEGDLMPAQTLSSSQFQTI